MIWKLTCTSWIKRMSCKINLDKLDVLQKQEVKFDDLITRLDEFVRYIYIYTVDSCTG